MSTVDLSQYEEITNLSFDHTEAHLAVCHKLQGYSANGVPRALLFKSDSVHVHPDVIKSLSDIYPTDVIQKISYNNKYMQILQAIETVLKSAQSAEDCHYVYPYLCDFSDDVAVFEYKGTHYGVEYDTSDKGVVTIVGNLTTVIRQNMYVSLDDTTQVIMKACDWKASMANDSAPTEESAPSVEDDQHTHTHTEPTNEGIPTMSEPTNTDLQNEIKSLTKAAADAAANQELAIQKALSDMQATQDLKDLTKSTTELVKSYEFVPEDIQSALIKSVVSMADSEAVLKALEAAAVAVTKANVDAEAIKKEFGQDQESGSDSAAEGDTVAKSREDIIKARVDAAKAKRQKSGS